MYAAFLRTVLRMIETLDYLEEFLEEDNADAVLKPYFGTIPVMLEGEKIGELVNDGAGWMYEPNPPPPPAQTWFNVGWTPVADMHPTSPTAVPMQNYPPKMEP